MNEIRVCDLPSTSYETGRLINAICTASIKISEAEKRWIRDYEETDESYQDAIRMKILYGSMALAISECGQREQRSILLQIPWPRGRKIIKTALSLLKDAKMDVLMKDIGYGYADTHYNRKDMRNLESLMDTVSRMDIFKKLIEPKPSRLDSLFESGKLTLETFGYIGAANVQVTFENGDAEITDIQVMGGEPYFQRSVSRKLSDKESELLRSLVIHIQDRTGWYRVDSDCTDQTSWFIRMDAGKKKIFYEEGYGDIPVNFDLIHDYLAYVSVEDYQNGRIKDKWIWERENKMKKKGRSKIKIQPY